MQLAENEIEAYGQDMYGFVKDLFPICRSLTGQGVRDTLHYIQNIHPELRISSVESGTKCFDWVVPQEWNIKDAYILDESGNKIVDFKKNNLHLVSYSEPVEGVFTLDELQPHLFSLSDQPDAIPYITSYYKRFWGFCMTHKQRQALKPQKYRVVIDSKLEKGVLNYAELLLPGKLDKEVLFSTYVCHPSMANNELSGPAVVSAVAKFLKQQPSLRYTYRLVFVPETIGAILYLSKHSSEMQKKVVAGFQVTCVGDDKNYSFLPSRLGNTYADKIAKHALRHFTPGYKEYSFLERGSDERQYCSPGIDLPVVSLMRSKYGEYPEYHTSLDNLDFVSAKGFAGTMRLYANAILLLENNYKYKVTTPCEPQLGPRGLYPNLGTKTTTESVQDMMNLLAYADGFHDLIDIANIISKPASALIAISKKLEAAGLLANVSL